MQFPIVREFKTDLFAENPENEVIDEPRAVKTSIWGTVIVPRHAPFFVDSLVVKTTNGKELIPEVDYRIFRLMSRLTMLAGREVSATVEILKPGITDVLLTYKVVGEFSLIDDGLLQLVDSSIHDDRPVEWENLRNKPVVFTPEHHGHSVLYDIVGWQDMVEFINDIIKHVSSATKYTVEIRLEYYFDLIQHFIALSRDTLGTYLKRHTDAYNSHGLTAEQVQLQNVDNFETARGNTVLQGREDMHVLVSGLKAIIDNYGFSPNEFLPANTLPISRFGNTNFIPPTIDGSFEGLGGQVETAGICQEADGSIVFLENRYDGRVEGLYYSVMQDPYSPQRKREYSGYRYTHQRLESDNAQVSRIAQGSGREVLLITDTTRNLSYVGLTFGSLNPARHVLSRIDLSALMAQLPTGERACDHIAWMQVFLMGDWIYISFAHTFVNRSSVSSTPGNTERRFRYYYRVPKAQVASQLPVTAVLQKLTYVDSDGVSRTNADYFRLYTPTGTWPNFTRCYFPIKQTTGTVIYGNAYSQHCVVEEIPHKPGKYVMKIIGSFLGSFASGPVSRQFQIEIEITYEFDPETGVMVLLNKTPQPVLDFTNPFIDWLNSPANWRSLYRLVYGWDRQGLEVLADGTILVSTGDYSSFPRGCYAIKAADAKSRYDIISRQWNTQLGAASEWQVTEAVTSPLVSGIKPKSFLLGNGGDFYTADSGIVQAKNKLYYRASAGGLAVRSDIQNKLVKNIRARPLKNTVWEVRGEPKIGGAMVTVPSNQLANYGTDLGYYQFCVGTQRRYLDLPNQSAEWTQPTDVDAIKIITGHTTRVNAQGLMEIVPTGSITYPASIVQQLKRNVDNLSEMLKAPDVLVVICDPTGPMVSKFGWLPTLVWISWGRVGTTERHDTMLSITPTYSGQTNLTVTGFTVVDKIHQIIPTGAFNLTAAKWDAYIAGDTNYPANGSMRVGFYLDGNELTGFFDSGITATAQGDNIQLYSQFRYANRNSNKRWSTAETDTYIAVSNGGGNAHRAVTPDNGVVEMILHPESSGGAATIFRGSVYNALLGSVYPEVGWVIFFQQEIAAVFNGKGYTLPKGIIDLRDVTADPTNKTFYLYAVLREGVAAYEIGVEKRLESPFQVWVGTAVTNLRQILTVERFNVFTVNGHRVSDVKRGNSIPSSTGLVNTEGQFPWLRQDELLP